MLQLKTATGNMNIIQMYAPTADKENVEIEEFYAELNDMVRSIRNSDITIIMGDFNAKVGSAKVETHTDSFGLGERNDRVDRLIEFCQNKDLMIANTFFKLPTRRLYTWKSPADTPENVVRYQIDYILNNRYKNAIKFTKTYPGADINSDHNPVVAKLNIKLKKITKCQNDYIDTKCLNDPKIYHTVKQAVNT